MYKTCQATSPLWLLLLFLLPGPPMPPPCENFLRRLLRTVLCLIVTCPLVTRPHSESFTCVFLHYILNSLGAELCCNCSVHAPAWLGPQVGGNAQRSECGSPTLGSAEPSLAQSRWQAREKGLPETLFVLDSCPSGLLLFHSLGSASFHYFTVSEKMQLCSISKTYMTPCNL